MTQRRKFSREFKLEAVKLVLERGVSAAQAACDLDVHANCCSRWLCRSARRGSRRATRSRGARFDQAVFGLRGERTGFAGVAVFGAAARAARPFWPKPILCAIARRASE
jgi:transposase-like protein